MKWKIIPNSREKRKTLQTFIHFLPWKSFYIVCYFNEVEFFLFKTIHFNSYYTKLYYTILYYTILYCTVLYCTVLYCTVLYCTVLYCTVRYCTVLYYTILYYIILYYTIPEKLELVAEAVVAFVCYNYFITFTISLLFRHFDKYFLSSKETST